MPRFNHGPDFMSDSTRLLGISNAIVDVLSHVDEKFLEDIGAPPGSMTLIDEQRAHEIYDRMGPATEMSGPPTSAVSTTTSLAKFLSTTCARLA
jgi:hypothetical protein